MSAYVEYFNTIERVRSVGPRVLAERNKDNRWFEINAHRWSGTHPRPYGQVRICGQQRAVAHIPKT